MNILYLVGAGAIIGGVYAFHYKRVYKVRNKRVFTPTNVTIGLGILAVLVYFDLPFFKNQ